MGFAKPSAPSVKTEIPVVSDTVETDTQADYKQKTARRKGVLATILTGNSRSRGGMEPSSTESSRQTLG